MHAVRDRRLALVRRYLGLRAYRPAALRLLLPVGAAILATLAVDRWTTGAQTFATVLLALAVAYGVFGATAFFALDDDDRFLLRAVADRLRALLPRGGGPAAS